ncbi:MAG: tetratricopeptide repeat-containing serine protease family protein [Methylacidiphilales bacterium]|nr:tetratricopeptide repeat-containing serine protease family protein [Candidatus Methylacidiphilales bacterium]
MPPPKIIFGFRPILFLAGLSAWVISANAQTLASTNQPGTIPVTDVTPASVALTASVQSATTNAPLPPSSETPQKTHSATAAPLPTWKEVEALPDYANATTSRRKQVFAFWLRQKAASGDFYAIYVLKLQKGAEAGDSKDQLSLGLFYISGIGPDGGEFLKDESEGIKWYRKAADQRYAPALSSLGMCYRTGQGVERDDAEAVKWYRRGAELSDGESEYSLYASYKEGVGVSNDPKEALKWLIKSANDGYVLAQYDLGGLHANGTDVDKDAVEAAKWYRKAADQGYKYAQEQLAECYYTGQGVKKDRVEAVKWYGMAAGQGYDLAQYNLGVCYDNGDGIEKDVIEAVEWYRKAAEQGYADAQFNLGLHYIRGSGVIVDEIEGLAWIYVSSAYGGEHATAFIAYDQKNYNDSTISAARQRATELQAKFPSIEAKLEAAVSSLSTNSSPASTAPQPIPNADVPKASGTGAFISVDGLVLTAAHVVQGASRIEVVTVAGRLVATVVKIDTTNDVALLKCTGTNFTPVPIAPSKEARAGTSVFTVGFPNVQIQGFDPKLTSGEISSQTGIQDDPRQWQISVPIQPGNSGGPLCDENGNLIGMVEATLNPLAMAKVEGEVPQNVNYAVKSSYILPLLDDVQNLPPSLGSTNGAKFEDVVGKVQKSVVLILVY